MAWRLQLEKTAQKELRNLPDRDRDRILAALIHLAADPPAARNVKALIGRAGFRLRVGSYRVLYLLEDEARTIRVERVGQRGRIYD